MLKRPTVDHQFQNKGKFALLTFNNVYTDLPADAFQLSDGTWVMPGVPLADIGIWNEWIGSIRMERLAKANLVLFVEEPSANPEIVDAVHKRLADGLSHLFYFAHLRGGIECESADLLCGSSENGAPGIRQMNQFATFYQSKGYRRTPITTEWLEDAVALRAGGTANRSRQDAIQARHARDQYLVHRSERDRPEPAPSVRPVAGGAHPA
jgi:hypothetical protein